MAGYPALRTQVKYGPRDIPWFGLKGLNVLSKNNYVQKITKLVKITGKIKAIEWPGQMCDISLFVTFVSFSFRFFITRTVWQYAWLLSTGQKHGMQIRTSTWWSLRDIRIPGATTRRRSSMSQNTHSSRDEVIRKSPLNRACKPHRKKSTLQHKTTDIRHLNLTETLNF